MVLAELANYAGTFSQWPGREWRSVEDTTHDPIMDARRPKPFASITRNEDYYTEGALVWLEADQIIRGGTGGRRGLDDFAKGFFGMKDGDWGEVPYEFGDVVAALNAIYPYDWADFLNKRINTPGQPLPLSGIERGGYHLVWKPEQNPYDKGRMADGKSLNLLYGLGIAIDKDGKIMSCRWDSAAFNAGLVPGMKIIAVGGLAYDAEAMKEAISDAAGDHPPLELVYQHGDRVSALSIPYHDGLRWPWLERTFTPGARAGHAISIIKLVVTLLLIWLMLAALRTLTLSTLLTLFAAATSATPDAASAAADAAAGAAGADAVDAAELRLQLLWLLLALVTAADAAAADAAAVDDVADAVDAAGAESC